MADPWCLALRRPITHFLSTCTSERIHSKAVGKMQKPTNGLDRKRQAAPRYCAVFACADAGLPLFASIVLLFSTISWMFASRSQLSARTNHARLSWLSSQLFALRTHSSASMRLSLLSDIALCVRQITPRQVDGVLKLISAVLAGPYVANTMVRQMLRPFRCNDNRTALRALIY